MVWTTPLVATLGMTLTIPLAMVTYMVIHKRRYFLIYILGCVKEEDGEKGYLVQQVRQTTQDAKNSDVEAVNDEGDEVVEGEEVDNDEDDLGEGQVMVPFSETKRKRDDDDVVDDEEDSDDAER